MNGSRRVRSAMSRRALLALPALLALVPAGLSLGCMAPGAAAARSGGAGPVPPSPQVLLGPVSREQVEAAAPGWVKAGVEAQPDAAAAHALASVAPGAEVTVLLGTWCGDS